MRRLQAALIAAVSAIARGVVRIGFGLLDYLADLGATTVRSWRVFFFTAADPAPLGVIRIIVGLLAIWSFATIGIDLGASVGSDGWADVESLHRFWADWKHGAPSWSLWLVVPDRWLRPVWVAGLIILALFTIGLFSRLAAILTWLVMVSTVQRTPVLFFGFDQALLTWLMYLAATGSSGQSWSVDRWLVRRRGGPLRPPSTVSANLALRLIQLHLCLIYASAGLAKLRGKSWWDGTAALIILVTPEYRVRDLTWLAAFPSVVYLLTHLTIALELFYPILVWVRLLRPIVVVGMILLHAGIELTLGLTEFSLAMIAGNFAFLPSRLFGGKNDRIKTS